LFAIGLLLQVALRGVENETQKRRTQESRGPKVQRVGFPMILLESWFFLEPLHPSPSNALYESENSFETVQEGPGENSCYEANRRPPAPVMEEEKEIVAPRQGPIRKGDRSMRPSSSSSRLEPKVIQAKLRHQDSRLFFVNEVLFCPCSLADSYNADMVQK